MKGQTATAELLIAKGVDVEAKAEVRQSDIERERERSVERSCADDDSHRESRTRWTSDWCGA